MNRKSWPYLAFVFFLLQSCFKNENAPSAPCYPSSYSEYIGSSSYQEFYTYDKGNRLITVNVPGSSSSASVRTITYQYDSDGKLVRTSSSDGTSNAYVYTNGRVSSITNLSSTNQTVGKQEYTYNNNGQVINRQTYTIVNNVLTKGSYYVYEYADVKSKNFTKRSFYNSSQVLQSTTVYTYDTKRNPNTVLLPYSPLVPTNNIIKIVTTPASGGTASTYTYQFSYTDSGYPTSYRGGYSTTSDSYNYDYNNCTDF